MPSRRSILTCLYLFAYSSNLLIVVLRADRVGPCPNLLLSKNIGKRVRRFEWPLRPSKIRIADARDQCGQLASPIATGAGTAGSRSGSIAHLVASEAAAQRLRVRFAPSDPKAPEKCAAGR